jgi:hypothetical protein
VTARDVQQISNGVQPGGKRKLRVGAIHGQEHTERRPNLWCLRNPNYWFHNAPMESSPLDKAVAVVGLTKLARACEVSHQAVRKWQAAGRLPRTEWTGETDYADRIERASGGAVTREALLALPPRSTPATTPAPALQQAPCA